MRSGENNASKGVTANEARKERKREINRLSAQRKRVRERAMLDTLTDRYAQLNYLNEALKADNSRLQKIIGSLREILATKDPQQPDASSTGQVKAIIDKISIIDKVRTILHDYAEQGQPARLTGVDPLTGSAARSDTNPFLQTSHDLREKVKIMAGVREALMAKLRQLLQGGAVVPNPPAPPVNPPVAAMNPVLALLSGSVAVQNTVNAQAPQVQPSMAGLLHQLVAAQQQQPVAAPAQVSADQNQLLASLASLAGAVNPPRQQAASAPLQPQPQVVNQNQEVLLSLLRAVLSGNLQPGAPNGNGSFPPS